MTHPIQADVTGTGKADLGKLASANPDYMRAGGADSAQLNRILEWVAITDNRLVITTPTPVVPPPTKEPTGQASPS